MQKVHCYFTDIWGMEKEMYNPSQIAILHVQHSDKACLKVGDKLFYDYTYNQGDKMNIEGFEKYLTNLYDLQYLSGDRKTASMVIYEIVGIK